MVLGYMLLIRKRKKDWVSWNSQLFAPLGAGNLFVLLAYENFESEPIQIYSFHSEHQYTA